MPKRQSSHESRDIVSRDRKITVNEVLAGARCLREGANADGKQG